MPCCSLEGSVPKLARRTGTCCPHPAASPCHCNTVRQVHTTMQLVLITPPTTLATEPCTVNRMFEAGLPVLHVRKPAAGVKEVRQYLQAVEPQHLNRVVLHQHHELTTEFPLKGIHFKERERPHPPIPRRLQGRTQSTSLHSTQDVLQDWQNLDYAFLSPIFDSISKQGYMAAGFQEQEVLHALQHAQMPVYALGGISVDKVPVVQRMGFRGIGLIGAVWGADDPCAALQVFLDAVARAV